MCSLCTGVSKRKLTAEFVRTENSLVIRLKTVNPMIATGESQILLTKLTVLNEGIKKFEINKNFLRSAKICQFYSEKIELFF